MKNHNHRTRRAYLVSSPYYKRIAKLRLNHPDKIEHREAMRKNGEEIYKTNFETFQRNYADSIAPLEAKVMDKLKAKNLPEQEYNEYMECWVEANMWPAPKDFSAKKKLKKLNKKYKM